MEDQAAVDISTFKITNKTGAPLTLSASKGIIKPTPGTILDNGSFSGATDKGGCSVTYGNTGGSAQLSINGNGGLSIVSRSGSFTVKITSNTFTISVAKGEDES